MNFVDAIDHARALASDSNNIIYIDVDLLDDSHNVVWSPRMRNAPKFSDVPTYRVWPDGKVERMTWTVQETIPNE